ncbi:GerMN domain-containing protein [Bacillus niameyensis]|uniref:GerMN domain-containing protein n=1 Tax=Bacillus niameyensis TaxID=1522308 RepID=UPI000782D577|nr:GerMN domain-containing protein [Bacillus niameyensis]
MSKQAKLALTLAGVLTASMFLTGCGLFGKDKESLDPPGEVTHLKEGENLETSPETETTAEENTDTVMRDIYLIDKNGYVVAQSLPLPQIKGIAKEALMHLVSDGPISDMLPNGFRTAIPAGTEVDVDIQDGVATVDFSEEFTSYEEKDEQNILESITWTLTQFDSVNSVVLKVNGYPLTEMPKGGTPISDKGLSRADGINIDYADVGDITNTRPVTVYYLGQSDEKPYYVPVTRRVSNSEKNDITAVINQLVEGPGLQTELASALHNDVQLIEEPSIGEGNVTLNFNEFILGNSNEEKIISNETLESIVLSLTEQEGIESVSIAVDGAEEIVNEQGEPLTAPVTRPEKVNTGSF